MHAHYIAITDLWRIYAGNWKKLL